MRNQNVTVRHTGGIGFIGLLTIVFITLKLLGYIEWSWIWVLSPMWGSCLFTLLIIGVVFIIVLMGEFLK